MYQQFSYQEVLSSSERFGWRIEDLIGGERRLNFSKPFLPESLARTQTLDFLTPDEQRVMNQIRGAGYLHMFGLVEEFILPFVLDHVRPQLNEDDYRVRAFLGFAGEEAKHIQLFHRFREEFEAGFGSSCGMIGPADAIARAVLAHHPLAVSLTILHIEWMTQRHFLYSVQDDQQLDPQFKSLLRHHWMEEVRHAKLDTLMVESIAERCSETERDKAIDGYVAIGGFLDGGLVQQVRLDLESFSRATGRELSEFERAMFIETQLQALRWTFIGSGMSHPNFLATVDHLRPGAGERLERIAPAFC
ncbi:MAG: diiron oxygenase [Alphaproteobacteria bacterium]